MLRTHPARIQIFVGAGALLFVSVLGLTAWAGDTYESILAGPGQPLIEVLPESVLESIEAPQKPVRVAQRPKLAWRSGASPVSKGKQDEAATAPPADRPKQSPATLRRVDSLPTLTSPRSSDRATARSIEPDAGELLSQPLRSAPERATAPEPDPNRLPVQAPRLRGPSNPAADGSGAASEDSSTDVADAGDDLTAKKPKPTPKKEVVREARNTRPTPKAVERRPDVRDSSPTETEPDVDEPSEFAPIDPPEAKEPPPPLTRSLKSLRSRMRSVLSFYYRQPLNTVEHDPWELMHGMLAYELHSRVRDGGPRGDFMTAVGHLCFNRPSEGKRMMVLDKDGRIDARVGVSLQGHRGQLMAMLAQCNVSPDYPIRVDGEEFSIHDLIEAEQRSCYAKTELTFKLIGLGHYLDSDARWLNDQGEQWDIPRLIAEERAQPIRGAACGGTHRLAGLSLAFRRREARNEPVDGEYAEAARFVGEYQGYAFRLQNSDGSLSTEWFRGRGAEEDIDRRLRTTGHTLEWLVYSLPDDQLRSHRTVRAVNYLTNLLAGHADHEWHLGSIGHALHALVLYDKRVFRPHDDQEQGQLAATVDPTRRLFRDYPIYRGVMRNSPPKAPSFFGMFGGSRTGSAASKRSR